MVVTFFLLLGLVVLGWWSYQWWTGRVGPWSRVPGTSAPAPSGPAPTSRPSTSSPPGPAASKGTPRTAPGAARTLGTADLHRATALIAERRYDEAATALEQARQRGLDMSRPAIAGEYYADLARVRSGRGQFRESLGPFREALHRSPGDPTLWLDYGWALESLGETAEARSAYNQALAVATSEDQRAQARAGLARLGGP
jgi:tetratricopeptide (TPR) repeat protein